MNKKYSIFITCLFVVFLGAFFVVNAVTPDKEFSPMENRTLAQAPKLEVADNLLNGKFMSDFETYVTDQFTLRDQWIALKARSERVMGKQENNGVYLGSQDTLIAKFAPPATQKDKDRIDQNFGYVETFGEMAGVPVYFSLIPGKVSVWADRLPVGAPNDDEAIYLTRGAQVKNVTWIDLNANLTAHKTEDIYFRTDHHWSTLGAYYGYEALMKGMGLTPQPLSAFTPNTVSTEFYGTTFSSSGVRWVKPDAITLYVPQEAASVENYFSAEPTPGELYDMSKLADKDKYSMFLGGNKPLAILKSKVAPAGSPKVLVVRDSFTDSLSPFLCYNFSEIHLFDLRYNKNSIAKYVAENGIDQVLVLYSVDNFVSDTNLRFMTRK